MATATVYSFDVELSDVDRGVYESLALRVARHPSETEEYLLTRVLAYCLEYREGSRSRAGLADPDEPALAVRDLTGALLTWIEIGAPDAARLHKASKAAPRVVVYTHKDPAALVRQLAGRAHPSRRGARALRHRSRVARGAGRATRAPHGAGARGHRSAALRDDCRDDPDRQCHAAGVALSPTLGRIARMSWRLT